MEVKGYTKPGFEAVREKFAQEAYLLGTGGDLHKAITSGGKK